VCSAIGTHHSSPQASISELAKYCTGVGGVIDGSGCSASNWSMMTLESCSHSPPGVTSTGITTAPVLRRMRQARVSKSTGRSSNGMRL
jgi:hypothetical protein